MSWKNAIDIIRKRAVDARGVYPDGTAKLSRGEAARLIDGAVEITDGAWDWFPPALAVLGYQREGDKFPEPTAGVEQLVEPAQAAYFWWALEFLAEQLDAKGTPVKMITQAPVTDAEVLRLLERVTYDRLLALRKQGASPTWRGTPIEDPWDGFEVAAVPSPIPEQPPQVPPELARPITEHPAAGGGGGFGILGWAFAFWMAYELTRSPSRR